MSAYVPVKKGTDPTPQIGLPQRAERRGGDDPSSPESQDVVDRHAATISSWVNAQRQNVANSIIPVHTRQLDHPEFSVAYSNIHGSETVTVTPKPVATPAAEPDKAEPEEEKPEAEEDETPPLADKKKDEVTEANPLSLMVFFYGKDDKDQPVAQIAGVAMKDLDQASVTYTGTPSKTDWVSTPGTDRLQIMQAKIGDVEFILLPVDISGKTTASFFHILTTSLGDTTPTEGATTCAPILNGGGSSFVYTMGGGFSYDVDTGFRLDTHMATETSGFTGAAVPQVPHAIGTDGACYFMPQLNSAITVALHPYSQPAFTSSLSLQNQVSDKQSSLADQFPTKVTSTAAVLSYSEQVEDVQDLVHGTGHDNFTVNAKTAQIQLGAQHTAGISATSYYAAADFGVAMQLQNFAYASGDQDLLNYTGGEDGYSIETLSGTVNILDNNFPLMNYSDGKLSVIQNGYKANQLSHTILNFDTSKPKTLQASAAAIVYGTGVRYGISTDGTAYSEKTWEVDGFSPKGTAPPTPDNGNQYSDGVLEQYYETLKQEFQALPLCQGVTEVNMVELTLTSGQISYAPYVSSTGEYNRANYDDTPFPVPDYLTVAGSYSGSGGDYETQSASDRHFPLSYPTLTSETRNATATVLGESFSFSEDTSTSAPLEERGLAAYGFPPMYEGKAFYIRLTGTDDVPVWDCITPYGTHTGVSGQTALVPWLHLSNGTDVLQGYYIDDVGYLNLNGSQTNYLTTLAVALGCKPEDICGMVMDVTVDKIKAVANVKPPDYSSGSAGTPGGGLGVD